MNDAELDLKAVVASYQQLLADAQLRAVVAETRATQYRAEIDRLTNILITTIEEPAQK